MNQLQCRDYGLEEEETNWGGDEEFSIRGFLATVRNKRVIDSERVQGHYLPVISKIL